ncbi:MAG TPA: alpha/beta fold hydrolase [Candidatus Dormibacteraeota bacterium]|nr:alpha/beta fold hydrolase [Candidatus Dormibacteraeota bacterium]
MTARSLLPFDPEVVRPWVLGEGPRGALLLHGFAGTPPELRRLGEHLAAHGWRCSGPAMAGHATTPEDLERTTWRDWAASAQRALDELAGECEHVVVAGQSMGGTMALHLAAHDDRIRAVATQAAPVWLSDWRLRLLPLAKHVVRWDVSDPADVDLYWPEAVHELHSYGRRPTRAIRQLDLFVGAVRRELPLVRQPVLVLHGGRDRVIDPRNAADIERGLVCSAHVERHMYPRSGHGMSVDVDRDDINQRVLEWFDRFVPDPSATARPRRRTAPAKPRRRTAKAIEPAGG